VVSNRGPVVYARDGGERVARRGGGGLVTALGGLVAAHEVTWVASALSDEDRAVAAEAGGQAIDEEDRAGNHFRLRLVAHDAPDYDRFYNVFSNPMLWFIHHELWALAERPEIDGGTWAAWDSYRAVNAALADAAGSEYEALGGDAAVMLHDYQLYTAPAVLRERHPEAVITHFVHVPWPGRNAWRVLPEPMRREICDGLLSCDVVGLHTRGYVRQFLRFCADVGGYGVDTDEATVDVGARRVRVRAYPISVDPGEFDALVQSRAVAEASERFDEDRPEAVVLRVDRTDPSKNIVRGFHAFDLFLEQHPEWHGRVRMVALLDPSRQEIPEYAEYLGAIQRAARQVGERWLDPDGHPAVDVRIHDNFPEVVAAYQHYDVLLVNALFDGMNLIAKEAPLVNMRQGVLILSENAGAHDELGDLALSVNPFDIQDQADAIAAALAMPADERARRAEGLAERVRRHDVREWVERQLDDLDALAGVR
jgi:trehalose 6-phosphate synthase